ncbi:hypothetical protein L596_017523 [Steinernema carpocapsae]|uniref:Uncharacterized protein n=1 Tax=Steinernema carpocapsae TaxID=34508 RepID=A0A4U5N295_STECR|nr:hypothetical protein L596_017523 [Steinernema carpocapsae]
MGPRNRNFNKNSVFSKTLPHPPKSQVQVKPQTDRVLSDVVAQKALDAKPLSTSPNTSKLPSSDQLTANAL